MGRIGFVISRSLGALLAVRLLICSPLVQCQQKPQDAQFTAATCQIEERESTMQSAETTQTRLAYSAPGSSTVDSIGSRYGYLSFYGGSFFSARPGLVDPYGSSSFFAFGGQVAVPVSPKFRLIGAITYFSKTGYPLRTIYTSSIETGLTPIGQARVGTTLLRQLLINAGTELGTPLSEYWTWFASAGVSLCRTTEVYSLAPSTGIPGTGYGTPLDSYQWTVGFFLGVALEYRFGITPWAFAGTASYNVACVDLTSSKGSKLGLNANGGIRYYFPSLN